MTEYYPLLARAVAGMRDAPPAQRQAIYDRARQALLGQLRSMQPPVAEASIERESNALDAAIARVEADLAGDGGAVAKPTDPVAAPAADTRTVEASPPNTKRVETRPAEPKPAQAPPAATGAADVSPPEPRPAEARVPPVVAPEPKITPAKVAPAKDAPAKDAPSRDAPAKPAARPARPAADALTRIVAERGPPMPIIRASRSDEPAAETDDPGRVLTPVPSGALPVAPTLQVSTFDDALSDAEQADVDRAAAAPDADETGEPGREEPLRPQAPRPITRERFNPRALILIAVGLAVVAGIGYAAWRLRDRPEQLARARQAMIAAQQAEQKTAAKISNRADGSAPQPAPIAPVAATAAVPAAEPQPSSPPADAAAPATQGAAATAANPPAASPPATSPAPDDTAAATTSPVPATAPTTGTAATAIAVAQRAAFLVDAPEEASKVKTYVGTVLWTTENATPGTDQPLARTVRADIDIPDAALKLSMVFQKNFEAQFPASHTLELHFSLQPGNTLGSVKQINVPQMRKDDSATGDPLIGLPVTIKDDYFLVGLSRGDATARNLDLIETRNWFDIPLLLVSNKVAKITFEKGTSGQQAIDNVLQSWQQR